MFRTCALCRATMLAPLNLFSQQLMLAVDRAMSQAVAQFLPLSLLMLYATRLYHSDDVYSNICLSVIEFTIIVQPRIPQILGISKFELESVRT